MLEIRLPMNTARTPVSKRHSSITRVRSFLQALIEPPARIDDLGRRRTARLLAIFLLILITLFLIVDISRLLTTPGYPPPWYGYILFGSAYVLTRIGAGRARPGRAGDRQYCRPADPPNRAARGDTDLRATGNAVGGQYDRRRNHTRLPTASRPDRRRSAGRAARKRRAVEPGARGRAHGHMGLGCAGRPRHRIRAGRSALWPSGRYDRRTTRHLPRPHASRRSYDVRAGSGRAAGGRTKRPSDRVSRALVGW